MKIHLTELRQLVREELERMMLEFEAKEMPAGTAWKVAGKGWAAKNKNGVTNYWYGPDMNKNKERAEKFRNDTTQNKKVKNEEYSTPDRYGSKTTSKPKTQGTTSYTKPDPDSKPRGYDKTIGQGGKCWDCGKSGGGHRAGCEYYGR